MYPVPHVHNVDKPPIDGIVFKTPGFCNRADRSVCRTHYEETRSQPGLHTCPYGYTTYSPKEKDRPIITGLKVVGHYDKTRMKKRGGDGDFAPVLPLETFTEIVARVHREIKTQFDLKEQQERYSRLNSQLVGHIEDATKLSHEIRNFNRDIKSSTEEINLHINTVERIDAGYLLERSETIFALSSLISTRLTVVDFSAGKAVIVGQKKRSQSIHAKFHKARQCLRGWALRNNNKRIELTGNSYKEFEMLPVFDLVPFILLENAIKYAPAEEEIAVVFDQEAAGLSIAISALGPKVFDDEISKLGKERFRSRIAQAVDTTGSGRGLVLVREIAEMHDIGISFSSGEVQKAVNGSPYAVFTSKLTFV